MPEISEQQKVTRAVGVVGGATLASRVAGFVRDLVVAYFFGAGPASDAFFVAFRIPNLLRRLFAEGTLTIAFIPVFTEILRRKGREEAYELAQSALAMLSLVLLLVCALGITFAPEVVRVMAPGFTPGGETYLLAVTLTRWCLPFIFFISLLALASGVLNSLGHFFAPAVATVLLNLSIIFCGVGLRTWLEPPVLSLAVGVLVGGVLMLILQVPYLKKNGISLRPVWDPHNPALRWVMRLMGPAAFGAAVYQITVLMNTVLSSFLASGSVSWLYYADRLIEFPLGIFAIAVSTAILPSLSRHAADGDQPALVRTMLFGLRLTMFICVPAMVGLMVLAQPLIVLLFERGEFGPADVTATVQALLGYAVGLWAFAGVRSVLQTFYALKDTRTPVLVAAACLVVNLVLSLLLMGPLAHAGLALATSAASACNLGGLILLLRRRLGPLGLRRVVKSLLLISLTSAVMAGVAALVAYGAPWGPATGLLARVVRPLAALAAGMGVYLAVAWVMKMEELGHLWEVLGKRR